MPYFKQENYLASIDPNFIPFLALIAAPGSTRIGTLAMAMTVRELIRRGVEVKEILILGSETVMRPEWLQDLADIFRCQKDIFKSDIDLNSIDLEKEVYFENGERKERPYTEHAINKLIFNLIDLGDSNIKFTYSPIPVVDENGNPKRPNADDEAKIINDYRNHLLSLDGELPKTALVYPLGLHTRHYYSNLLAAGSDKNLILVPADKTIVGNELIEKSREHGYVYFSTATA